MLDEVIALIASHGAGAGFEAGLRADRSRDLGNVAAFCRWRQAGRLIALLAETRAPGTVH